MLLTRVSLCIFSVFILIRLQARELLYWKIRSCEFKNANFVSFKDIKNEDEVCMQVMALEVSVSNLRSIIDIIQCCFHFFIVLKGGAWKSRPSWSAGGKGCHGKSSRMENPCFHHPVLGTHLDQNSSENAFGNKFPLKFSF